MQVNQFKGRVDSLLLLGVRELSLTLGVLARIENENYEIVAVQSNSGAYVPGEKYALGSSYSREVFVQQKTIAVVSESNSPLKYHHPSIDRYHWKVISACRWRSMANPGDAWISAAWPSGMSPSAPGRSG